MLCNQLVRKYDNIVPDVSVSTYVSLILSLKKLRKRFVKLEVTMAFGKKKVEMVEPVMQEDPTGWMLDNPISEFILMHTFEIQFMCMVGYCFYGGKRKFKVIDTTKNEYMILS